MVMPMNAVIFSDLDRTIIPNGPQLESRLARPMLRQLVNETGIKLVYVSGRSQELIKEAIAQYDLPIPDFAVGDVGTTIYQIDSKGWKMVLPWQREISESWQSKSALELAGMLTDLEFLTPQESTKQSRFKLSYYLAIDDDHAILQQLVSDRLAAKGIKAAVISSIDESENKAFLDVLPINATKLHAVRFLVREMALTSSQAVFCGDSGNDLPVLTSEIPAVLVANATQEVRTEAIRESAEAGHSTKLYLAKGIRELNGNYSAGVLEGAAYFLPTVREWLSRVCP